MVSYKQLIGFSILIMMATCVGQTEAGGLDKGVNIDLVPALITSDLESAQPKLPFVLLHEAVSNKDC